MGTVTLHQTLVATVALLTLLGVALGRYPVLRMNRATLALVGATLMVVLGGLPLQKAYAALDMDTLVLLFAMMVINVNLRLAGFFGLVAQWVVALARTPRQLLALLVVAAGILSALFLNDTIVLMFTPLVLELCVALELRPVPYLVALVSAANVGSLATIIGNPQNMIIGTQSGIPFATFTARLGPVALAGLALTWLVLVGVYRTDFRASCFPTGPSLTVRVHRPLLRKCALASLLMVGALGVGAPIALASLAAAAFLLVTRRVKPQRVFQELDWSLLVFFSGLFVVTGALGHSGLTERLFRLAKPMADQGVASLTAVAVVLSNLVSNVPAVMLFRPLVGGFEDPHRVWLVLAMATTLAGNLTLLGSVANLIVAEGARQRGVHLGFLEYLKAGVPITLATLLVGILWLS